jgi:GT2 family glycosyltransferase
MAFRREALERIGGFDERLGAGTPFPSEDLDAAAAALWAGYSGVYDPRPVVYHDHGRRTADAATALMASYDAGRGAYYAKNVLRSQTRSTYLRAWAGSIKRDVFQSLPQRRLPVQSMRELRSGLRFMTRGG